MIALHALWTLDSELCVWGEQSSLPARARGRPGRPPVTPRPRPHPFACGAGLVRTLSRGSARRPQRRGAASAAGAAAAVVDARASGVSAPAARGRRRRTARRAATAARCVGGRRGRGWRPSRRSICCSRCRSRPPAGVAVGESVRYLAEAVQAGARAGGARTVAPRARAPRRAVGRPLAARDRRRRRRRPRRAARRLMPPLLRAELSPREDGNPPDAILGDFLAAVVDACARELLRGPARVHVEPSAGGRSGRGVAVGAGRRRSGGRRRRVGARRARRAARAVVGGRSALRGAAHVPDLFPPRALPRTRSERRSPTSAIRSADGERSGRDRRCRSGERSSRPRTNRRSIPTPGASRSSSSTRTTRACWCRPRRCGRTASGCQRSAGCSRTRRSACSAGWVTRCGCGPTSSRRSTTPRRPGSS